MKASVMQQYGGPEVLIYSDFLDPAPVQGEVLIRVAAASVNPVDLFQRSGGTKDYLPVSFPGIIGWDVAGIVEALGPGVTSFAVGDRVMAWAFATYAELCAVNASVVSRVPDEINLQDAAALPLATPTGSQLISEASGVKPGLRVLVSGAAGTVARAAVRTAKDQGATVIAGIRADQRNEGGTLGADEVLALDDAAAFARLEPVDIVANTVKGDTASMLMDKIKAGGTFASVTGPPDNAANYPRVKVVPFVSKQSTQTMDYMAREAAAGRLTIPIALRMPLSEARKAHEAMAAGVSGKILLIP